MAGFVTLTPELLEVEMCEPGGGRELLARYPRPDAAQAEYRSVDATRVVRRQKGGSFHTDDA